MKSTNYKSRTLNNHLLRPETLMMGYGYAPGLSEGALKPPIFLTSTVEIAAMPLAKTAARSASSQIARRSSRISKFGLLKRE